MLRELKTTRQIPGENTRRWFSSAEMDLIVWLDHEGQPLKFELCFNKSRAEQCLRWSPQGHSVCRIDSGEAEPGRYKSTPIHRPTEKLDAIQLHEQFKAESSAVPPAISSFVFSALNHLK